MRTPSLILLLILLFGCKIPVSSTPPASSGSVKDALKSVEIKRKVAKTRLVECERVAWGRFVGQLKMKGDPVPGRPNLYKPRFPGAFDEPGRQQRREDDECMMAYRAELARIGPTALPENTKP